DFCVYIWNIHRTDEPIKKLVGHESAVTGVAFNHRGTLIATLGQDETVRLWFPAIDKTQVARRVDGKGFERLQFSRNDRLLTAIDARGTSTAAWEGFGDEYIALLAHAGLSDYLKTAEFSHDACL